MEIDLTLHFVINYLLLKCRYQTRPDQTIALPKTIFRSFYAATHTKGLSRSRLPINNN